MTGPEDDAVRRALMLDGDAEAGSGLEADRLLGEARLALRDGAPEFAILIGLAAARAGAGGGDLRAVLAEALARNRLAGAYAAHDGEALDVAWSPEGMLVASAGADGTAAVWDFASRTVTARLEGHEGRIRSIAFNPVEPLIVTAGDDGAVRVWNAADGRQTARVDGYRTAALSARFSPRGHVFTVAADAARAAVLSNSGAVISRLEGHEGLVLYDAAFSADGKLVVTAGDDGAACVWDAASGERRAKLTLDGAARSACFNRDASLFAVAGYDGRVRIARSADGRVQHDLPSPGGRAYFVAFTPGDAWLACAGADGAVGAWRFDPDLGATRYVELAGPGSQVTRLAACPAPQGARVTTSHRDGAVVSHVLGADGPVRTDRFVGGPGTVWSVAARPGGSHLAAACADGRVRVWSTAGPPAALDADRVLEAATEWAERLDLGFSDDELVRLDLDESARRPWRAGP